MTQRLVRRARYRTAAVQQCLLQLMLLLRFWFCYSAAKETVSKGRLTHTQFKYSGVHFIPNKHEPVILSNGAQSRGSVDLHTHDDLPIIAASFVKANSQRFTRYDSRKECMFYGRPSSYEDIVFHHIIYHIRAGTNDAKII